MTPLGHGWEDARRYIAAAYGRETGKLDSTQGVCWHKIFCVRMGPNCHVDQSTLE